MTAPVAAERRRMQMCDLLVLNECRNLILHGGFQSSTTLIGFIKAEWKTLRSVTGERARLTVNEFSCSL